MWTHKNTSLSAESIIFFSIKRWTVKVGFFDGKISVEPLCNASTDFNASALQRTLCPALHFSFSVSFSSTSLLAHWDKVLGTNQILDYLYVSTDQIVAGL